VKKFKRILSVVLVTLALATVIGFSANAYSGECRICDYHEREGTRAPEHVHTNHQL